MHVVDNKDAEDNPATAHMFIVNPLHAKSMDSLFSTHPNMTNRLERLSAMAQNPIPQSRPRTFLSRLLNSGGKPSRRKGPWS